MTSHTAAISNAEADIRWRYWLARGEESDRRTARRMSRVIFLIAITLAIWLSIVIVVL